jgi:hypothetical protein
MAVVGLSQADDWLALIQPVLEMTNGNTGTILAIVRDGERIDVRRNHVSQQHHLALQMAASHGQSLLVDLDHGAVEG